MRKIEREMQKALCDRRNWRKDNTEVAINDHGDSFVYLHGHNIATIANNGDIRLSSCGWQTNTTKSRLNAVLDTYLHGASIFQKNFDWYFDCLLYTSPSPRDVEESRMPSSS